MMRFGFIGGQVWVCIGYEIFTWRVNQAASLICSEQGAFVNGCCIINNVLIVQEFIYELRCAPARQSLMTIKLDMERTYDRMSWYFIRRTLQDFGFQDRWISWIMDLVEVPTFGILVNGAHIEYFCLMVGLWQGCPLFPYLFILCIDALFRALRGAV